MAITISDEILDELSGGAKTQGDIFGSDGLIKELLKRLVEHMLETEMMHHLGYEKQAPEGKSTGNSRNGKTSKTVKTGKSEIKLDLPRDRNSQFEPMLVGKRQTKLDME